MPRINTEDELTDRGMVPQAPPAARSRPSHSIGDFDGFGLDDPHQPDQAAPPLSPNSPSKPTPAAASGASPEIFTLEEADAIPAKTPQTLSLNLEIEGLDEELEKVVGALLGKVFSLPPLRIRIKGDDLG